MNILSMSWLAPFVLSVIILIGLFVGYLNGVKTSLYLFVWNIFALIISISTFRWIYPEIINIISFDGIKQMLKINSKNLFSIFGLAYLVFITLIMNFLAFILYWIIPPLRKSLNKKIKLNRKNGASNKGLRFFGAGLGIISVLPLASVSASLASITNKSTNRFTKINSIFTRGITFAQYEEVEKSLKEIRSYILISKNNDVKSIISSILGQNLSNLPQSLSPDKKKNLENLLNSKLAISTISDSKLVKNLAAGSDFSNVDFSQIPQKLKSNLIPNIELKNRDNLVNAIFKGIVPISKNKNTTKSQVHQYITQLLGW